MWVTQLPWQAFRATAYSFRRAFGMVNKPVQVHLVVDEDIETLKDLFQKQNFEDGWLFSYIYEGEDANLRRPEYKGDKYEDYQAHARFFKRKDGKTEIYAHVEVNPLTHPRVHLKEENLSVKEGLEKVEAVLDQNKISYKRKGMNINSRGSS